MERDLALIEAENLIEAALIAPDASDWLKDAIRQLLKRDPADAVRDAEALIDGNVAPHASTWLKDAKSQLLNRDPADAAIDVLALADLFGTRLRIIQGTE
jgi:hypothetical protein